MPKIPKETKEEHRKEHSASHKKDMRTHHVYDISAKMDGQEVTIGGWVNSVREQGSSLAFLIVRDFSGTAQVIAKKGETSDAVSAAIKGLGKEDVVLVTGKVKKSDKAPGGYEIVPSSVEVLNRTEGKLPLDPNVPASLDTRLQWRYLDFRNAKIRAIFKIQGEIIQSFRQFFKDRHYMEMQPPCIISSASEGGAELFAIPYFEKEAFLAQSPQLYKQMGAISFEKVFCVMPVWRAEKHDTPTHLNEVRQMDCEQAFVDDEGALKVLEECVVHMLKQVKEQCAAELKLLGREDLIIPKLPFPRVTYSAAIDALKSKGQTIEWGEDFSKLQEKMLYEIFGEAFFLKDWPTEVRAFYSMPYENNPKVCKAYDLLYRGLEISSGAQRIHIPELLIKQLKKKGLNPDNFEYYINCFRYGAPPHSGWSIGLERFTMQITGQQNVREAAMFPRDRTRISP